MGPNLRDSTQSFFLRCFLNKDTKLKSCAFPSPPLPSPHHHRKQGCEPRPADSTDTDRPTRLGRPPGTPEARWVGGWRRQKAGGRTLGHVPRAVFRFRHFRVRPSLPSRWALYAFGASSLYLTVCTTAPSLFPAGGT